MSTKKKRNTDENLKELKEILTGNGDVHLDVTKYSSNKKLDEATPEDIIQQIYNTEFNYRYIAHYFNTTIDKLLKRIINDEKLLHLYNEMKDTNIAYNEMMILKSKQVIYDSLYHDDPLVRLDASKFILKNYDKNVNQQQHNTQIIINHAGFGN